MKRKKETEITLDTIVQRDPEQEFSKIDDEVVMLSLKNGEYYALNEVASRIWELIEDAQSVFEIVKTLINEYEISQQNCEKETMDCILDFNSKKLIIKH